MFHRALFTLFALLLMPVIAPAQTPAASPPPGFAQRFNDLAELLNNEELSPIEFARATLLATQVFNAGPTALPYVQGRFLGAKTQGEASLGGVFLVSVGGVAERVLIRAQTESNMSKRKWIWPHVSSEAGFMASVEDGQQWQAAVAVLPSAAKCRALAELCMDSRDMLTRRAGLFWGYWVADAAYWKKVQAVSQTETDKPTQRIAQRLLAMRSRTARQ